MQTLRPTVLIGCEQQGGAPPFAFDQHVIGTMADNAQHPLIFPLTSTVPECQLRDAYVWSGGRAIVATCAAAHMGPLSFMRGMDDAEGKELLPSQITSTYIFPGVGECVQVLPGPAQSRPASPVALCLSHTHIHTTLVACAVSLLA